MNSKNIEVKGSKILIMGLAFKENCPDLRNTQVSSIIDELKENNICLDVFDPVADAGEAEATYGISLISNLSDGIYDAILLAVAHDEFRKMGEKKIRKCGKKRHILYDIKYVLPQGKSDLRL